MDGTARTSLAPIASLMKKRILLLSLFLFLPGEAAAAYEGDAGGYATGLLGAGYRQMLSDRLSIRAELLAGPAGGGRTQYEWWRYPPDDGRAELETLEESGFCSHGR